MAIKVLDTWILAGQSNAEGYGISANPPSGLQPAQTPESLGRAELNTEHQNVHFFLGENDTNQLARTAGMRVPPLRCWLSMGPYEGLAYVKDKMPGSGRRFGPELSFAFALQRYLDREIAMIKFARGSASLASGDAVLEDGSWNDFDCRNPRFNQYDKLQSTIEKAVASLNENYTLNVRGVLWMQGETDACPPMAPCYEENLRAFIAAMSRDLRDLSALASGKLQLAEDFTYFLGLIAGGSMDHELVRKAMQKVAESEAQVFTVDAQNLSMFSNDDWNISDLHYDTAGQIELGQRFAEAVIRSR